MFKGKTKDRPEVQESMFRNYAAKVKQAYRLSRISMLLLVVSIIPMFVVTMLPVVTFLAIGLLPMIPVVILAVLHCACRSYAYGLTKAEKYILYDLEGTDSKSATAKDKKEDEDERVPMY
jgi:uncharacterized membrane protein